MRPNPSLRDPGDCLAIYDFVLHCVASALKTYGHEHEYRVLGWADPCRRQQHSAARLAAAQASNQSRAPASMCVPPHPVFAVCSWQFTSTAGVGWLLTDKHRLPAGGKAADAQYAPGSLSPRRASER